MNKREFEEKITQLLPELDNDAMKNFHKYSSELDEAGTESSDVFYNNLYKAFETVEARYGKEISMQLFNLGETFTLNPHEVEGAAEYISDGTEIYDIRDLAIDGMLDSM